MTSETDPESTEKKPSPESANWKTFERPMLKEMFKRLGLKCLTDEDGDYWVSFSYSPEINAAISVFVGTEGKENSILSLRCDASRSFEHDSWEEFLVLCNQWNIDTRWPKAFAVRDDGEESRVDVYLEHQVDLSFGVTDEMLDYQFQSLMAGVTNFWRWANPLLSMEASGS